MNQKINTLSVTNPPSAGIDDTVVLTSSTYALDAAVNFLPTDVNSTTGPTTGLIALGSYGGNIYVSTDKTIFSPQAFPGVWYGICASSDGNKLAAVNIQSQKVYISDGGGPWTVTSSPSHGYKDIACSSDRSKIVAVAYNSNFIVISDNSGAIWTEYPIPGESGFLSVCCSADGTKIAAGARGGGQIWLSTNGGLTWQQAPVPQANWYGIACSADGAILAAIENQNIWLSTNSGATWTQAFLLTSQTWRDITCSADGTKIFACSGMGTTLISGDGGVTWTQAPYAGYTIACNPSGQVVVVAAAPSRLAYVSSDAGNNWTQFTATALWLSSVVVGFTGLGININAHGLIDGQAVYFYTTTTLPAPLQAFTTYYVKYIDANNFGLSATYQGSAITLTDQGTGVHSLLKAFNVRLRDPWDNVLNAINLTGLSSNQIAAINASDTPNSSNALITNSYLTNQLLGKKGFVTVGPAGSNADFESDDDTAFAEAINFILTRNANGGWIIVIPGTYNFTNTVTVPSGICIEGVHPQTAIIVAGGNFSAFELTGSSSRLDKLQIQAPSATTKAVVKISGEKCIIEKCLITNFTYAGLQVAGYRNKVISCRIEDTASAASQGIILQSFQNNINGCSFVGSFNSGALKVEGNDCGCFNSYFDSTLVGYSYLILSDSVSNTRLVGNHFGSNDSLILSYDYGTTSVRYGNTPNTPNVNQNNFALPLANYTGQPTLSTSSATLSNNFTTNGADNLTDILSNLDLFLQRSFEERNFFLSSNDPTYDPTGVPTAGVGSWNGSTLSVPTFYIHSTLARAGRWVVNSASYALDAGQVLYVEINQTLDAADIVLTPMVAAYPLPLTASTDAWRLVLAVGLGGNQAIWLEGFRLLTGMTSFDIEGTLLPLARFIGVTDIKNPSAPFNGFAAGTAADLTTKLGAQSKLLENLYERTNLSLEPVTSDAEFSTDPVAGNYLDTTVGLPSRPTHIVQAFKLTYALVPTSGLYVFDSVSSSWSKVTGHPPAPDFTALSFVGVSIGILTTAGAIAAYNPYLNTWATYSPVIDEYTSILLPFASSRGAFPLGGQADYALQTDNFTYFTTLNGYTVRYSLKNNTLNYVPRAYTQDVGDRGLLGPSLKDSAYNTLRDTKDLFETLDNGVSYTTGLPCSKGKLINFAGTYWYSQILDFSSFDLINFAYDEFSGAWLAVYTNNSYNFILGGGKDTSYLYSVQGDFDDFQTHYWVLNPIKQEVIALGAKTSTGAFTAQISSYNVDALTWTWTTQILGVADTSQGCIAIYDTYSAGDLWVLVSNPARSNRPTVWKRNGTTGNWTSTTLTNSVSDVSDTLVPAAVANSFLYVATGATKLKGYAAVSPTAINFYVADNARSNRPTVFNYNKTSGSYTGVRLAEAAGAGVDVVVVHAIANSADIFLGAFYHAPSRTNFFAVQRADNYTVFFAQHEVVANFAGWTNIRSNLNQFTIPSTKALITNKITGDNTDSLNSPYVFYLLCSQGFITITLGGSNSNFTSVISFSKLEYTSKLLGFSSTGTSIYIPQVGSLRGGEPSVSVGSWAKTDTANIQAAGIGLDPGLGDGIFWSETGSYVKHIKRTSNGIKEGSLWSGVNRGGYLWIADSSRRTRQTELTPNHITLRGNYDVTNLGAITGDYDFSTNGTQVAFVYANSGIGNVLSFLLWDIETETVLAYERGGVAPLNPAGISACGSTPQILYNTVTATWDIVVQDDSREGGQVAFYRRTAAGVWSLETIGAVSGNKTLPAMVANAGLNPCKPVLVNNGDIVLCTSDISSNLLIFYRVHSSNQWATSGQITGGGFNKPVLAVNSLGQYWVFGGYDGANARIAKSNSYVSGFSVYSSDISDVYNRVFNPRYYISNDAIIVASPLTQAGTAVANQEMGVFRFPTTATDVANIFAAKGRLIGFLGEEEIDYGDHSFTSDGKLLYSAERFGRTDRHYSIRISRNGFKTLGDSALGSGRLLTLGNRCYREEYASASRPLIVEYDYDYNIISYRDNLPVAEREPGTFLTLRYPYAEDASPSNLFSDANLPSGILNAVEAREFPLICGNTRIQGGPGAGLLYFGAMVSISALYLPATNLLRLEAMKALTIKGTWKITAPNSGTAYIITGPIVYMLDASATGSHLVLQFPNAGTLTLDSVANPLTYWSNLDYTQNSYALVLGEVRERYFTLYSKTKLTYGNIENTVLANPVKYYTRNKEFLKEFFITPLTIDSLAVQEVGALDGIQKQNFSVLGHLLLVQGLPPNGTGYHYFVVFNIATADRILSGMKFQHVAGKFENIVVFNS